jgi:hypothetical protein
MFGEKKTEYAKIDGAGKDLPVYQTPKYLDARKKAIEIIEGGKHGVTEADFWILMNLTSKKDKMAYSGLILSHNGCLKINDRLESKFDPACVTLDKEGWGGSLVYTYCNPEQGIYENGEVSKGNCQNQYPYAMAFKRCFDRVVLKLSKLAYEGIMSDSESDDFKEQINEPEKPAMNPEEVAAKLAQTYNTSPEDEARRKELLAQIDAECKAKKKKWSGDLSKLSTDELAGVLSKLVTK